MRILLTVALAFAVAWNPGWAQPSGIVHLLYPTPVTVSGIATDSSDNPVPGARIQHIAVRGSVGIMEVSAEADSAGRFHFDTLALAVVFRKDGFESQLVRIPNQQTELHIVLKPALVVEGVPICRAHLGCVSVGAAFCFPKVKGVYRGEAKPTIDTVERLFIVRRHRQMIHGAGLSWGGPTPRSREVWTSIVYKESTRLGGRFRVIDASGKTADGKVWRSVGVPGESAFYYDLDPESGAIFDRVLDGLCFIGK